jgi:hypothetical protein
MACCAAGPTKRDKSDAQIEQVCCSAAPPRFLPSTLGIEADVGGSVKTTTVGDIPAALSEQIQRILDNTPEMAGLRTEFKEAMHALSAARNEVASAYVRVSEPVERLLSVDDRNHTGMVDLNCLADDLDTIRDKLFELGDIVTCVVADGGYGTSAGVPACDATCGTLAHSKEKLRHFE